MCVCYVQILARLLRSRAGTKTKVRHQSSGGDRRIQRTDLGPGVLCGLGAIKILIFFRTLVVYKRQDCSVGSTQQEVSEEPAASWTTPCDSAVGALSMLSQPLLGFYIISISFLLLTFKCCKC